jgi:hypothetical protein
MSSEPEKVALTIEDPPDVYEFRGTVAHPKASYTPEEVLTALGFLSAALPELHGVEVPRIFSAFMVGLHKATGA